MQPFQEEITLIYLDAIENELQGAVKHASEVKNLELYDMLAYHMGWTDTGKSSKSRGKRIRPLFLLLVCSAAGGDWKKALPAAAAVELIHNFSLIHDDIEDRSPLRRGRATVWKKWGIPQAINAGDAMFTMAHLHLLKLSDHLAHHVTLEAIRILQQACLHLTEGQFLDLSFEKRSDVSVDDYWLMIEGKTAALLSACTELGALTALCDENTRTYYRNFGRLLGLAFQTQDDILGIWGDSALTGKSSQSDLVTQKKTLPILQGLSVSSEFRERWKQGPIYTRDLKEIIALLEKDGIKSYSLIKTDILIKHALDELDRAHPVGIPGEILKILTLNLLHRQV